MSDFKFSYRGGTSFARGTTIDEYLTEEQNAKLYELWQNSWGEPFRFHGGISAITCEMVLATPKDEFLKIMGKKDGSAILQVASNNAGR